VSLWATARWTPRGDLGQFVSAVVTPAVRASVEASCAVVQEAAKAMCPVDTGALRDSIATTIVESDKAIRGYVAPGMSYAGYVEFGTGRRGAASAGAGSGPYDPNWPGMVAQPYMRPAVDESHEAVMDLFRSNMSLAFGSPYK
jgi:HK97 gp10 family phage protein